MTGLCRLDSAPARLSPACRVICALGLLLLAALAQAAAPAVSLRLVAGGFAQPLGITHAGDRSGRLFVTEKTGRIRIVKNGVVNGQPFLDVSDRIATSGERGLLGLAFHPQYAVNRRFFVFYTGRTDGALTVASFLASLADPDRADATSEQVLLTVPHPSFDNHNGGNLAFGPDGFLYVATGDGGSGGDPTNNAQNLASRLGKLLRLDVNGGSAYTVPASNPFAAGPAPEIWAYGLRNPWRFSFDRATGDLFIGDVGQDRFEEVDYQPREAGGGQNYGWHVFEGTACYVPASGCALANHTPPVITYGRALGQAVTGGYVYRGVTSRDLYGYYLYGDFSSNSLWAARRTSIGWTNESVPVPANTLDGISSFGEDESGEIHVASLSNGRIYALQGPATARFDPGVVSGLWWNPAESGWGVQFTQRGASIFATLYHYGADGNPKWYVTSNCARVQDPAPLHCIGALEETRGPRFFGVPFDSSAVQVTAVGSFDATFHDSEHATLTFNVGSAARTVELQRQVFRSRSVALDYDFTDLYYNSAEPGWGLTVSHQGPTMFLTWYVYDDAGRPVWYAVSNCAVNPEGSTCEGALHRVTGPPLGGPFDPSRVQAVQVGQASFAFLSPDLAAFSWTIGGVQGSKAVARQRF